MKTTNLQDTILNAVRKERLPITLHLVNGVPIKGNIRGFDNFVVLVDSDGRQMMIYKHAISTITPSRPVQYTPVEDETAE
jgi:host factor-I protein